VEVRVAAFALPKAGNAETEYEDACYPPGTSCYTGEHLRFAVADGASEGLYSGAWAQLLVKVFGRGEAGSWLERSFRSWDSWQRHEEKSRVARGRPLQWFEEPGWRAGAFAAFLGLSLSEGSWKATAVGDCCLFLVRAHRLHQAFPLDSSSSFSNRPALLCSRRHRNQGLVLREARGRIVARDRFYLMTDALACYFLQEKERGKRPGPVIAALEDDFSRQVENLRKAALLKNDDVTMVSIQVL
jgi:hypothetical protein